MKYDRIERIQAVSGRAAEERRILIKKLVRSMLTAQVLSALTVSICLLIDNVLIVRFLGTRAIAAYGYANPVLMFIGALGSMLSAGVQVSCSRSLGRGLKEETDAGYSSAIAVTVFFSLLFMLAVILLRRPLASFLGAAEPDLHDMTSGYLAGFVLGAPASMGALVLIPFLQMAGRSGLLIVAVISMTVSDVALDLLNALVLHWGMFGMGLASALSYCIALLVSCLYFLSKKCVFRFSLRGITRAKIAELFRSGLPSLFGMASSVLLIFAVNRIMRNAGGTTAVAALTVALSLLNAANCISTGIGGVSLTLTGVFFHEEDRHAIRRVLSLLCRWSVILGLAMGAVLLLASPLLVDVFLDAGSPEYPLAVRGLRIFALGLIPCCVNNALRSLYQATGRILLMEILSLLEGAVFPILAALGMSFLFSADGVWFYFVLGELLTLLTICLIVLRVKKRLPWQHGAAMLLKPDFGVRGSDLLEIRLSSLEEIPAAVERVESFCRSHGLDAKTTNHISLCVEEMSVNVVGYGFSADEKPHHLFVRLLRKKDMWVLRFRDDCTAFDPVRYVPPPDESHLGIKIVLAMARDVRYTSSLNLNNLMIQF